MQSSQSTKKYFHKFTKPNLEKLEVSIRIVGVTLALYEIHGNRIGSYEDNSKMRDLHTRD